MTSHPCSVCAKPIDASAACLWDAHTELAFCSDACARAPFLVTCPKCHADQTLKCVGHSHHPERVAAAAAYAKKLFATPIEELIERSSLGAPHAKYMRDQVDKTTVERVLARADELQNANVRHLRNRK